MRANAATILAIAVAGNVCASLALRWAGRTNASGAEGGWLGFSVTELIIYGGALGAYSIAFAAYALTLRSVPVSIAYPLITGLTTISIALAAGPLFGESLSVGHIAGIVLVLAGTSMLFAW